MRRPQKVQKLDWLITILHPRLGRNAVQWRVQEARLEASTAQRLTVTAWAGGGRRCGACALFVSRPSKVPFIENNISLIEFAREKVT